MCACVVLFAASQSSALIIDHFEDDITDMLVNSGTTHDDEDTLGITNDLSVATDRNIALDYTGPVDHNAQAFIALGGGLHYLSYANSSQGTSTLTLTYTMDDNADLSTCDYILIKTDSDLGDAATSLYIRDALGNDDTSNTIIPAGGSVQAFSYADFATVDFTKVVEIVLTINGGDAFDADIDAIECGGLIPEPVTMLGLFLGLGGVGAYIRKRRMA